MCAMTQGKLYWRTMTHSLEISTWQNRQGTSNFHCGDKASMRRWFASLGHSTVSGKVTAKLWTELSECFALRHTPWKTSYGSSMYSPSLKVQVGKRMYSFNLLVHELLKEESGRQVPVNLDMIACTMREVLLAGGARRKVAELSNVRIDDLASPFFHRTSFFYGFHCECGDLDQPDCCHHQDRHYRWDLGRLGIFGSKLCQVLLDWDGYKVCWQSLPGISLRPDWVWNLFDCALFLTAIFSQLLFFVWFASHCLQGWWECFAWKQRRGSPHDKMLDYLLKEPSFGQWLSCDVCMDSRCASNRDHWKATIWAVTRSFLPLRNPKTIEKLVRIAQKEEDGTNILGFTQLRMESLIQRVGFSHVPSL